MTGAITRATKAKAMLKRAALAGSLILILSSCVSNASQDTLKAHGSIARLENSLFIPVFWIAVAVFCLIAGLVSYCVFRFRARSDDEAPRQVHGNTRAEIAWTIAPALLLASIAIPTVKFVFDLSTFPKDALTINVTGHRWWWQADYANRADPTKTDFTTATEIHIPVKEKVVVTLTSVDVIHNFWVPELAGKLYAIPGRHNKLVIEADTPGTYYGQCAEYCGTSHANMRLRVIAQTPDDYATWVTGEEAPPVIPVAGGATDVAATGAKVFGTAGCAGCHTITGISDGVVGPNLTHFASRSVFAGGIFATTDNNLRLWLANPPGQKPGSVMPNLNLSEPQINQLIAYLDTLK
jgi:cytochrome c oxidase subunit 2